MTNEKKERIGITGTYKRRNDSEEEARRIGFTPIKDNSLADANYFLYDELGSKYRAFEIALRNSLEDEETEGEFIIDGNTLKWEIITEAEYNNRQEPRS